MLTFVKIVIPLYVEPYIFQNLAYNPSTKIGLLFIVFSVYFCTSLPLYVFFVLSVHHMLICVRTRPLPLGIIYQNV